MWFHAMQYFVAGGQSIGASLLQLFATKLVKSNTPFMYLTIQLACEKKKGRIGYIPFLLQE